MAFLLVSRKCFLARSAQLNLPCKLLLLPLEDSCDVAAVIYGRQESLGLNEAQHSAVWSSTDEGNVNVTSSDWKIPGAAGDALKGLSQSNPITTALSLFLSF